MIAGIGSATLDRKIRQVRHRNRNIEIFKKRFRKLGIPYTKGFVAARYNNRNFFPRWLITVREFFWIPEEIEAAKSVLMEAGVDPWCCGDDLFQFGEGIEQD